MNHKRTVSSLLFVLVLIVFAVGCPKKADVDDVPEPAPPSEETTAAGERADEDDDAGRHDVVEDFPSQRPDVEEITEPTIAELNARRVLHTVYFAFDRHDLTDEARRLIRSNSDWLTNHPQYGVVVEGHCDERGTIEYNLALGQRRARAVREYLVGLGIDAERVRIISYGEERPLGTGHDESSWSRNRRGEFVLE